MTLTEAVVAVTAAACLRAQNEQVHRAASDNPLGKLALRATAPQWHVAVMFIAGWLIIF